MAVKPRKPLPKRVMKQKPVAPTEAELAARTRAREAKATFGKATNKTFMPDTAKKGAKKAGATGVKRPAAAAAEGGFFAMIAGLFGRGGKAAKPGAKAK